MGRTRVALIYGGKSGEHEVSLVSAYHILQHLDPTHFDVVAIGIDKQGQWFLNQLPELMMDQQTIEKHRLPARVANAQAISVLEKQQTKALIGGSIDVVFPIVHGTHGEDGCLQGFLEMADLPYVGANVLASALGMDKDMSKRLACFAGVPIGPYKAYTKAVFQHNVEKVLTEIQQALSFPVFVKPNSLGSSVGIHKVSQASDLLRAIEDAFEYDDKVIIEAFVNAQEIELSVLENPIPGELPLVSIPGEIRVTKQHAFYSYEAKYLDPNGAELFIPAPISVEKIAEAQALARAVFTALDCESMARVDFFLERETGKFFFNEINTIPGFTPISMYPKMWEASGLPYKELLRVLIDLSIARHRRKNKR